MASQSKSSLSTQQPSSLQNGTGSSVQPGTGTQLRGNAFAADALAANQRAEAVAAAGAAVEVALGRIDEIVVPGWDGAVVALDPEAALAAAQLAVTLLRDAAGRAEAVRALDAAQAEALDATVAERGGVLTAFLSPQRFGGVALLGTYDWAPGGSIADLAKEAGKVVDLLSDTRRIVELVATGDALEADQALALADRWRGRPVDFAFLTTALESAGVLERVRAIEGVGGASFPELETNAAANGQLFGALTDVGAYDDAKATEALERDVWDWAVTDGDALGVFEQVMRAPPTGREAILRHFAQTGRLDVLCGNLPGKAIEALAASVSDADLRRSIQEHAPDGGPSMGELYEEKILSNLIEDDPVDAFLWNSLQSVHNGLTGGFVDAHDAAWEANREGHTSSDGYMTETALAAGRAAAETTAGAVTGGAAGAWSEGLLLGMGASRSAALVMGGAAGGAIGNLGAVATGDAYGTALQGQEALSSAQDYGMAAAVGAGGGLVGAAAMKYAAPSVRTAETDVVYPAMEKAREWVGIGSPIKAPKAIADAYAEKFPGLDNLLTRIRGAGVRSGLRVKVTKQEMEILATSGLADSATTRASYERWRAVMLNERVDISQPLAKVYTQKDLETYFGPVDPETGRVTQLPEKPSSGGFSASAEDLAAQDLSSNEGVNRALGLDGTADWYAKYRANDQSLYEVVFKTNVELDTPLPQDYAEPGQLLGGFEASRRHLAGTGRSVSGVREGVLPAGAPIEVLDIRPIGDARTSWPAAGGSPAGTSPSQLPVRNLNAPLISAMSPWIRDDVE